MNKMRKKSNRLMLIVSVMFGCLIILTQGMVCSAADVVSVELEVCQEITGDTKEDAGAVFIYEMTAQDPDTPMPEGTENGKYTFQISGVDSILIAPIQYYKGGVYTYEIERKSTVDGYLCGENSRYTVMVYVKNTDQGLEPTCIYETEEGAKAGKLLFTYEKEREEVIPEKAKGVKTGDTMESEELVMLVLAGLAGMCIIFYEGKKQFK